VAVLAFRFIFFWGVEEEKQPSGEAQEDI